MSPWADGSELYCDPVHMNIVSGRYLMHNAMRSALGQPRSAAGFERLPPATRKWLDSLLDQVG